MRFRSRRGGIIFGLFLAATLVLVAILAAVIIVVKSVRVHSVDDDGSDIAISLPDGHLNIRARDRMNPALTGIPVYPGAYREKDGGASIQWDSKDGDSDKDLSVAAGEFRTRDSVSQVVEFYRKKLPDAALLSKGGSEYNRSAKLEYRDGDIRQIISIHRQNGETRIGVAAIGGRASN